MFGLFKSRKRFNGDVDTKVNNEYDIRTRENPNFPGIDRYLQILDEAWNNKFTEDEAAMFVATLYYSGLVKAGKHDLAEQLRQRLATVPKFGIEKGTISIHRLTAFLAHIEGAQLRHAE